VRIRSAALRINKLGAVEIAIERKESATVTGSLGGLPVKRNLGNLPGRGRKKWPGFAGQRERARTITVTDGN